MTNWLVNRLRPAHAKQTRWVELAEALQEFWAELFDLQFDVLANMRSVYTADESSQLRKTEEYGWYYEQDMPAINRPIFFGMRKLEMLQKETDVPMMASIKRLGITGCWWEPLYAVASEVYGTRFLHSIDIRAAALDQSDLYLTSRGVLMVDYRMVNDEALLPKLEEIVRSVKPLHIIFEKTVGILRNQDAPAGPYIGCASISGECVSVYPLQQTQLTLPAAAYYMGACTQIHEKITIYPQ